MSLRADLMAWGWGKDLEEAGWVAHEMKGVITFTKLGCKPVVVPPEKSLVHAVQQLRKAARMPIYPRETNRQKIPMYVTCTMCGREEIHVGLLFAGYLTGSVFVVLRGTPPGWAIDVDQACRPRDTGICPKCNDA